MAQSKKPKSSAAPVKKIAPSAPIAFPAKELTAWLKSHQSWNHNEWIALLADLKKKGFGALVGSKEGQDSIGLFIETHR